MQKEILELQQLKSKVEEAVKKREVLKALYETNLKQLVKLGYGSIEEAEAALEEMRAELDLKTQKFNEDLSEFKVLYADFL